MESKLSRYCDGLIEAGWLAAVIVTPLFFNIHSSRVFEPDKLTLLRSIASLMAATWLIKFIDNQGWRSLGWIRWRSEKSIWRMPFVLPVFLLVIVYLLSTLFSVTPAVSWAGSYQRLQGTYTTLSYVVVFALMLATLRRREQINRLVTTIIIISIPISLYAMLQNRGLDPLPWGGDVQLRVAGHMGNSIFIAAYLIMVVPLTLARIIDAFTNILHDEEMSKADVVRSSIYIFALAIQLIAIYWTRSRGPFLGLAVSIYAFVLILLVTLRNAEATERRFSGADFGRAVLVVLLGTLIPLALVATILESRLSAFATFAAFAGAVGLLVLVILVLALARRGWRWLWLGWILLALVLAGVLGLFNLSAEAAEPFAGTPIIGDTLDTLTNWRTLPEIGRFGQLLQSERGSGRVRVLIWEGVLELIGIHKPLEEPDGDTDPFNFLRPVLGYGPESMYVAYNRFYQPELATIEARNASPDRSHNETFDALVITGGAGLLVWQFLYLSVFYYGFRWLGVVRSNQDRNILIGLWIGGALIGGLSITALLGMPFLGVALPFGAIGGLVMYLIYYALFARQEAGENDEDPYSVNRLLMIALVAAVLAHYVEIHFGIAIAATRTHFFVYVALMFLLGYLLPRLKSDSVEQVVTVRGRRRRKVKISEAPTNWSVHIWAGGVILALILGILAYNFTTYSLPPGESIQGIEDVPSAFEIFRQSFFVNPANDFVESPFVYLLFVLTWVLAVFLFLSEIAKAGLIGLGAYTSKLVSGRLKTAGLIFLGMVVVSVASVFLYPRGETTSSIRYIGNGILWLWAAVCLLASFLIFLEHESARLAAGIIAAIGLIAAIPVLVGGAALYALVVGGASAIILYLIWDKAWSDLLKPALILSVVPLIIGVGYAFFHATMLRSSILPPREATEQTLATVRRVLEADQTISLLTWFYVFLFVLLFIIALPLAWQSMKPLRSWGNTPGFITAIILIPAAFYVVATANLRVIQADIVYKRADPWDKQAGRSGDPAIWDNAIAIYEHAIELAPLEDFYYLWLGRAYLERSSVTQDPAEQEQLLTTAEEKLIDAQRINPLNTDHTANLARLNTRWAELAAGEERLERADKAADYYEAALSLSPRNAVVNNEYARLVFLLQDDCEKSLELYDRSIDIDPYYDETYAERAEIYKACGDRLAEGEGREPYYEEAAKSWRERLSKNPGDTRSLLQLTEVYVRLGDYEQAVEVYNELSKYQGDDLPQWQIDYTMAQWFLEANELDKAETFAQQSLDQAPAEVIPQIQQFLNSIGAEVEQVSEPGRPVGSGDRPLASLEPAARNNYFNSYPQMVIDPSKHYEAVIQTGKGDMVLSLFAAEAPLTVNNFVFLATQGFYDGTTFHRVIDGFMAQGGDPTGSGAGGPGYQFEDETTNDLTFDRPGLLAMANRGPATNGSQFFITFVPTPHLNGDHTIFGELIDGEDVLNALTRVQPGDGTQGDIIQRIDIYER